MTKEQIIKLLQDTIDGLNGKKSEVKTFNVEIESIQAQKNREKVFVFLSMRFELNAETAETAREFIEDRQPLNGYQFVFKI